MPEGRGRPPHQSNANQSLNGQQSVLLGGQLAPLSQSCRSEFLEIGPAVEVAFVIEVIMDRGVH